MPWTMNEIVYELIYHKPSVLAVVKNLVVIVLTIIVLFPALRLVRGVKITENTKKLLLAEHGEDEDESATDEDKIKYQMYRRLMQGEIFWNTGSWQTDFMFFTANKHPVLQFFAHDEVDTFGNFIRGTIEANAILFGFQMQLRVFVLGHMNLPYVFSLPANFLLTVLFPMVVSKLQFETIACPCQSSSAVGGHMDGCGRCCKNFGQRSQYSLVAIMFYQIFEYMFVLPWDLILAAVGGRCIGYLLFFLTNYVTWNYLPALPGFGKWEKKKKAAEELLNQDTLESPLVSPKLRGESCAYAACYIFLLYVGFFLLDSGIGLLEFYGSGMEYER